MSDAPAADKTAPEGGAPDSAPVNGTANAPPPAEQIAPSEGGAPAPVEADRAEPTSEPSKVENKPEVTEDSKTPAKKDTNVAGRKEKGASGSSFWKKLMPWKKSKKETKAEP